MSIKKVVLEQYRKKVNQTREQILGVKTLPTEGWLRTARKALAMSAAQLAQRLGVTKARVFRAERDEVHGGVSLKTMQSMALAMGCRFVYAVVPEGETDVEDMIQQRALNIAKKRVGQASTQMALEGQVLNQAQIDAEVKRIASQIVENPPSDFWGSE